MAFCNSCGSVMEAGARFCPKCGTAAPPGTVTPAAATPAVPLAAAPPLAPAQGSSALKIILIVVAVIVGLGILGLGATAFFVHRVISRSHIHQKDGDVRVETPFGTMESTTDPGQAAHDLGVDLYPGATVVKGGATNMTIGGMHTAAAEFESSDPVATVADFYKSKFPHANVTSGQEGRYNIISSDKSNLFTITIEPRDGKTRINIAKVTGKMVGAATSND
jgi:zinc-ribbon domain